MSHPETQVRTPAKRVDQALLKRMFAQELERRFPKGIKIVGRSGRKLRLDMTPGLSVDEQCRLKAELKLYAADPSRLDEFVKKLKDVEPASRERIADTLVAMAAADGSVHPDEVRQLEKLFRIMSFDQRALYARLHEGAASARSSSRRSESDDLPEIIPAGETVASTPIPPPPPAARKPKSAITVDSSRLQAIREETRVAAGLLAEIFADELEPAAEMSPVVENEPDTEGELFEGLERRYGSLLLELRERGEWAASEFAHLAREAGLMPAVVFDVLNNWALDLFDELLLEDVDPVIINLELLPNASGIGHPTHQMAR